MTGRVLYLSITFLILNRLSQLSLKSYLFQKEDRSAAIKQTTPAIKDITDEASFNREAEKLPMVV
ncbi:hypothetical protein [Brevibacillus reuszeri]|uniref:hypothetical protein n=1 Tax=Brevibacillus reuszeri TaxID=54915 RepID=UPI0013DF7C3C|nr:hypothetical protein [Brevibacillus reuszeri]